MIGKATSDESGNRICFNYQQKTCTGKVSRNSAGLGCERGLHVCAEKGCGKEHAAADHK
jgi:hypothetical protein